MSHVENISNLLEKIQAFQVVKCNMHHERVAFDSHKKPIYRQTDKDIFFDRVSLCDVKHRKLRLGCAHSSVNMNFIRLLESLEQELPQQSPQFLVFKETFNDLISKIYALDHKKGQLEHDLALFKITSDIDGNEQLKTVSKTLKAEHEMLMDQLLVIKSDIELFIKTILNNTY
ncbi:hypothetical protein [Psychroserpens luteolus]|uniref:hypothetical protein n=1 Tax=Psychroserpens luteolus TaxID=2855840 RepID=UPI001E3343CA|nr:hypothetical protein [Psychroserpens luteolus]MCD2260746.1 hypothetical protein [Psychroserpens luteolus]